MGDRPCAAHAAIDGECLVAPPWAESASRGAAGPVQRDEWPTPGDLVHLDIKPLGRIDGVGHRIHGDRQRRRRGVGWDYVHVAVDDHSRVAYVEVLRDQLASTCAACLRRTVAWCAVRGIVIRRVMSDNGSGYVARLFHATCEALQLRHLRTRAYTPRKNGKAERFIQTLIREWASAARMNPRAIADGSFALSAVLQPQPTTREPGVPGSLVTAQKRCVMNNVLELNS